MLLGIVTGHIAVCNKIVCRYEDPYGSDPGAKPSYVATMINEQRHAEVRRLALGGTRLALGTTLCRALNPKGKCRSLLL